MKITKLSLIAALAMSSAFAGGDIEPVAAPVVVEESATTIDGKLTGYYITDDYYDHQVNHSYKQFHVANIDHPYFRELMFNSFRSDDPTFGYAASGQWNINPENRVQLPAIFVEVMGARKYNGYQYF